MPFIVQAILMLAVLGFVFWLLQRHAPIASPFKETIYFVAVVALALWLLEGFGVIHTRYFHWR